MTITGISFRDMVVSAASALENNKEEINNLNVYPVPDGDTGVNMSMTMSRVRTSLSSTSDNLSECAKNVAGMKLCGFRSAARRKRQLRRYTRHVLPRYVKGIRGT